MSTTTDEGRKAAKELLDQHLENQGEPEDQPDETVDEDQADDDEQTPEGKDALLADLAKARKQRNEARTEAEQAWTALTVARAQLVDQVITRAGYKPAGVRAGGLDEDALFDEDGALDTVAAKRAVDAIARDHGLAATKAAVSDRGRDRVPPSNTGWQSALTGN